MIRDIRLQGSAELPEADFTRPFYATYRSTSGSFKFAIRSIGYDGGDVRFSIR
jgi:hypothetical protein